MSRSMEKSRFAILLVSACIALVGTTAFAATNPELVKQEAGYYYGFATESTLDEASIEAKRDLVSSALTTTIRASNAEAPSIKVSVASAKARLESLKPYAQTKAKVSPASVTYRMKITDWDKNEKKYQDALRIELAALVDGISKKSNAADKMSDGLAVLARLADEGETDLLTAQADGTELLSRKVEAICTATAKALVVTISTKDGFVTPDTKYAVKVTDASGNAVTGLTLSVTWEAPLLPTTASVAEVPEVIASVKTDSLGEATIDYPVSADYHNRPVTLTVATIFASAVPSSASMKKLDADCSVDAHYVHFDDLNAAYPSVTVPAGKFNAGAVPQDTRAGRKEAAHEATTGSYAIDVGPVTNAEYADFVHITRSETMPEYFDNTDYNQGNQPVVGVSEKEAEAYAAWLSEQTGRKYRLPTEEEWEKAARGGKETIYPWGDDSPAEAKKANYKGNGNFTTPSPVGSFDNGKNEWGIVDMAGNVWEWTSSTHSKEPDSTLRTVKGGSWMDGPAELRISNSVDRDSTQRYADVGFRLVMEVSE